ncbi:hypothetical protein LXL04_013917 [Taraxacum kok-saghyz]
MQLLGDFRLSDSSDGWRWEIASDGVFSVAETREWIDNQLLLGGDLATRWSMVVPRKVNIFIWKLRLNILSTRFTISARGLDIPSIMCLICRSEAETVDHVFWRCAIAKDIWMKMFRWLQILSVNVFHLGELFEWVDGCRGSTNRRKVIEALVCITLWMIWRFRNDVVHEARNMRKDMLVDNIKEIVFVWIINRFKKVSGSWNLWLLCPLNAL